jgi:hypothetical protein
MTETQEERCEAGCIAYHGGERRHHPDCVFYPESFTRLHDDLVRANAELQSQVARLQAALDAALAGRTDRGAGLPEPQIAARETPLCPQAPRATHRHRKGGLYRLLARGRIEATLEPCAIYQSVTDDLVWVRPEAEFEDGRFTRLVPETDLPTLAPLLRRDGSHG